MDFLVLIGRMHVYVDFMWSELAMHGLHMHWHIAIAMQQAEWLRFK